MIDELHATPEKWDETIEHAHRVAREAASRWRDPVIVAPIDSRGMTLSAVLQPGGYVKLRVMGEVLECSVEALSHVLSRIASPAPQKEAADAR